MDLLHRIAHSLTPMLMVGILLAAALSPAYADGTAPWLASGQKHSRGVVQPGIPPAAPPFPSQPGFVDRSPPISQRPFAQPFIERGPSFADRPLAPIGMGRPPTIPDSAPYIWCQGRWVRAAPAPAGCLSR